MSCRRLCRRLSSLWSRVTLGRAALPSLTGSAFLFGADLGVEKDDADLAENSDDLPGVDECLGALPVEITSCLLMRLSGETRQARDGEMYEITGTNSVLAGSSTSSFSLSSATLPSSSFSS